MKRYPVVHSVYSAGLYAAVSCILMGVLMACTDNGELFSDVGALVATEPLPEGTPSEPAGNPGMPPVDVSPASQPGDDGEAPLDVDLPLDTDGPMASPAPPAKPEDGPVVPVPPAEPLAPTIVAVSPEDGATAVGRDAAIIITFSRPMNQELTERAYQSESIPSSAVSFAWNEDGTQMTVTPVAPLEYEVGTDPQSVQARRYSFFLSASAQDVDGNGLDATHEFSFSVYRQITATFTAIQDRDLSGSWRSNDTYGQGACARDEINMCVGDSGLGGVDQQYRGFISFDLSSIPSESALIADAQLNLEITGRSGNPFNGLGDLFLEHARFDVIGPDAFRAESLADMGRIATEGNTGTEVSVSVLPAVEEDVLVRGMTQYRLQFEDATDSDGNADMILSSWGTQRLELTYLLP